MKISNVFLLEVEPSLSLSLSLSIRGREHDSLFSPSAYCYWPQTGAWAKRRGKRENKKIQFLTLTKEQECNLKIRIQTKFQVYN
jgi:hypothetical protein